MLSRHFIYDLSGSDIEIVCGIDKNGVKEEMGFPVIGTEEDIPESDAIIVTPVYDFLSIKQQLGEKGYKNIISIESLFA